MRGPKLRDARARDLDDPLRFLATAQSDLNEHQDRPVGVTLRNARAYHGVRQALANGPLNGTKAIHADAVSLALGTLNLILLGDGSNRCHTCVSFNAVR